MVGLFAGTQWEIPPVCERCGATLEQCRCTAAEKQQFAQARAAAAAEQEREQRRKPPEKQTVRIRSETRKAKRTVTVIAGLSPEASDLPGLLKTLKDRCGVGGHLASDPDRIELQGDQVAAATRVLEEIGYRVRP